MYLLEVYVTNSNLKVDRPFVYYSLKKVNKYARVKVDFNNKNTTAIVFDIKEYSNSLEELNNDYGYQIKEIRSIVDDSPVLNDKQLEIARWLAKTTISPFISCLNVMLPKILKTSTNIKESKKEIFLIKKNSDRVLTKKQNEVLNMLPEEITLKDANKISPSIIKKLEESGYLSRETRESEYKNIKPLNIVKFKKLTSDQQAVYDKMIQSEKIVSLLFGVTGSGKTEVYLHLARFYLSLGKEVLILVPEISLTPQMISRVKERFSDVIFFYSGLNDTERYEQYKRVIRSEAKIVVGTRSSIFLPFNNLGLIIIDEEHDSSYKQDSIPLYETRNVARKIAMMHNAKVLLASATPSLDSYTRALKGDYNLFRLDKRINLSLPKISIVDMSLMRNKKSSIISNELIKDIDEVLSKKHQAIILLNRRGYSPIIKCADCGEVMKCHDCDIPLSYHKDENILKCHQCGRTYKIIKNCPNCHSNDLVYYGFGTKRIEEEIERLFPSARVKRMDKDSTNKKGAHERILSEFDRHEIDILIGTQMIAKGLDYPLVELVGIINADAGLMHQDYNAAKQTLDLLMQASGRSGRSDIEGKVVIQAFNPNHYVLKAVMKQDYNYFYNIEMNYRRKAGYPPYTHLIAIYLHDIYVNRLENSKKILIDLLSDCTFRKYPLVDINKINKLHRSRIIIVDKDLILMLNYLTKIVNLYISNSNISNIKIDIDPNYLE